MWVQYFIATISAVSLLAIPGFGPLRCAGFDWLESVCYSPLVSVALISSLCILYGEIGVFSNWLTVLVPLYLVSVILTFASLRDSRRKESREPRLPRFDSHMLMLYVAIAVVLSGWYFVRTLNGPESFSQEHDNIHHLLQIRAFIESGDMSTFHVNLYAPHILKGIPIPETAGNTFYPSGWHDLAALTASLSNSSALVAQNALIWAFLAFVIPVSSFTLLSRVFFDSRLAVLSGAFLSLSFSAFPWQMLVFGPLYPNCGAFSIVLPACDIFIEMCETNSRKRRITALVVFLVGGISLAVLHPNSVFTASLLLFPYCLMGILNYVRREVGRGKMGKALAFALPSCFVGAFALAWSSIFNLPAFRGTTSFYWSQMSPPKDQLMNVLTLSFHARSAQLVLGAFVLMGFNSFLRDSRRRWLALSYVLLFVICFFCGLGLGSKTSILSGFWYNDLYRVGASMAIVCLPLACKGLVLFADFVSRVSISLGYEAFAKHRTASTSIVLVSCALIIYAPSFLIPGRAWVTTAFGDIEEDLLRLGDATSVIGPQEESLYYDISDIFDLDDYLLSQPQELGILSIDEYFFMAEVADVVEDGALILNQPHDGSVFGNIKYDLNVYYVFASTPSQSRETFESRMVRTGLNLYGTSELVHDAVDRLGASYVMILDLDGTKSKSRYWYGYYDDKDWLGLNAINDDTPGFEVVLSRGDMRLYRIVR